MATPCFPSQITKFPFTQDEVADIYKLAKDNYFTKGMGFGDAVIGLANDLGMRQDHIVQALSMPKVLRSGPNSEVWKNLNRQRQAIQEAKRLVEHWDAPKGFGQKIDAAFNVPRSALTTGHAGVFPQSHMGQFLFVPSEWGLYFKASANAWRFMSSKEYEIAIQKHLSDPYYDVARSASKSVDPAQETVGILKNMKGWSGRGYNALKVARLDLFKKQFKNTLAPAEQIALENKQPIDPATWKRMREDAKPIMSVIDAATGEIPLGKAGPILSKVFFATKLLPARFKSAIYDPIVAAKTFANWKNASGGARQAAIFTAKMQVQTLGFYAAAMALNQGVLSYTGSKDKINFFNPNSHDWLSFKIGGFNVRPPNALIEATRFLGGIVAPYAATRKQLRGEDPNRVAASNVANYLSFKLHPTIQLGKEIASGTDLFGRPLPFDGIRQHLTGEKAKASASKPPVSVGEYIADKGPIPIGGAAREVYAMMRDEGMDHTDAKLWLKTLAVFATEAEGIPLHEITPAKNH